MRAIPGSAPFREILKARVALATVLALLAGLSSVVVVSTVTSDSLGSSSIKLFAENFTDDSSVTVVSKAITKASANAAASGTLLPGVEAAVVYPTANNALARRNFVYALDVRETAADSWQLSDRFQVKVYMDNGSSTTLLATVYIKQDSVDDTSIEGVSVEIDTGSQQVWGDVFSTVITRQ